MTLSIVNRHSLSLFLIETIVLACVLHLLFSKYGFAPTDDGFMLAYSRRLLEGQIPHRDFIIIRPALTPLLHLPELLAGEYTFLLSRFVFWIEVCFTCTLLIIFLERKLAAPLTTGVKVSILILAVTGYVHTFPPMAWYTQDGLLLASLGLVFLTATRRVALQDLGCLALGAAVLCKQSFVFVPVLAFTLRERTAWVRSLALVLVPGCLYVAFLVITGSFHDALLQLVPYYGFRRFAVVPYFSKYVLIGSLAGVSPLVFSHIVTRYSDRSGTNGRSGVLRKALWWVIEACSRYIFYIILTAGGLALLLALYVGRVYAVSFLNFGLLPGLFVAAFFSRAADRGNRLRCIFVALLLSWSASISVGYNWPALGIGFTLALAGVLLTCQNRIVRPRLSATVFLGCFAVAAFVFFTYSRLNYSYYDLKARSLTYRLDGVLPGGSGIRTNQLTYAALEELRGLTTELERNELRYAILPAFAGWWPECRQTNPLAIDCAYPLELHSEPLRKRFQESILSQKGQLTFVVCRKDPARLYNQNITEAQDTRDEYHDIRTFIRSHFDCQQKRSYFDVYQ